MFKHNINDSDKRMFFHSLLSWTAESLSSHTCITSSYSVSFLEFLLWISALPIFFIFLFFLFLWSHSKIPHLFYSSFHFRHFICISLPTDLPLFTLHLEFSLLLLHFDFPVSIFFMSLSLLHPSIHVFSGLVWWDAGTQEVAVIWLEVLKLIWLSAGQITGCLMESGPVTCQGPLLEVLSPDLHAHRHSQTHILSNPFPWTNYMQFWRLYF